MKVYFKGDSGIKEPVDMEGNPIKEGNLLTNDYGDYPKYNIEIQEHYPTTPFYIVKINDKGGYYAESIKPLKSKDIFGEDRYFFLHDFRFKYCKLLNK